MGHIIRPSDEVDKLDVECTSFIQIQMGILSYATSVASGPFGIRI